MNALVNDLNVAWHKACTVILLNSISDQHEQTKALGLLEIAFNRATKAYAYASNDRNADHPETCVGP